MLAIWSSETGLVVVVPIFVGFDEKAGVGRLFKYDITGGRYEETNFDAQGSGSKDARDSLKKLWKREMPRDEALRASIEALIDAADEDVGTGGPDLVRGIFPTVKTITRSGFGDVPEDEVKRLCPDILDAVGVSIDKAAAESSDLHLGEQIELIGQGRAKKFRLVGFTRLGSASFGGASIAQVTLPVAQRLTHKVGRFDQIFQCVRHQSCVKSSLSSGP